MFDYKKLYEVQFFVNDAVTTLPVINATITKGIPIFWWNGEKVVVNGELYIADTNGENIQPVGGGDALPINSIFEYDGDTVPDGYELVLDYSTTEQIIGTWIDGKPIYRRTFVGNTGTSAQTVITSAYNNDTIRVVNAYGSIRTSSGGTNIGSYVNGNYYSGLFIHSNELQLYFGSSLKSGTYMITIEFTKTTD